MSIGVYCLAGKRVWVAGHNGMVGSAVVRRLAGEDCTVLTVGRDTVDLTRQTETDAWMAETRPQVIFLAAARVGGIHANNSYPARFLYDNLTIETNVINAAWRLQVEKLLFLGSSCIYPREAPQPIPESALLTGPLEATNQWYAVAKIAGIKLCQAYRRQYGCDFISAMPTNLYGPGDNFHPQNSHVPAALLLRLHQAKRSEAPEVMVWGAGTVRREFLHVDDLADACLFLIKHYSAEEPINVGTGHDLTIADFAELIRTVVRYRGRLSYDTSRPDGTPRKLLDTSRLRALGWSAPTSLETGMRQTYTWFLEHENELRQNITYNEFVEKR